MTTNEMPNEKKYWWSDDEEIIRSEAFETREQAYSDAYCSRAQCFDDPSQSDGFYLHHGKMVDNPDFDEAAHKHYGFDESNFPMLFEGETEKIDALTVTDLFHDQWVKLRADLAPTCGEDVQKAIDIVRNRFVVKDKYGDKACEEAVEAIENLIRSAQETEKLRIELVAMSIAAKQMAEQVAASTPATPSTKDYLDGKASMVSESFYEQSTPAGGEAFKDNRDEPYSMTLDLGGQSTPATVTVESNGDLEQSELAYVLADAIDVYDTTAIGGRLLAANHVMKVLADKYPHGLRIVPDADKAGGE